MSPGALCSLSEGSAGRTGRRPTTESCCPPCCTCPHRWPSGATQSLVQGVLDPGLRNTRGSPPRDGPIPGKLVTYRFSASSDLDSQIVAEILDQPGHDTLMVNARLLLSLEIPMWFVVGFLHKVSDSFPTLSLPLRLLLEGRWPTAEFLPILLPSW